MKLRTVRRILRERGLLGLLDNLVNQVQTSIYVWKGRSYGLREAVLFPNGFQIDLWTRYSRVAAALTTHLPPSPAKWRILEVGSGGPGLAGFMRDRAFWARAELFVADLDAWLIGSVSTVRPVVANALQLLFADKTFDAVLAIDILEHLSPEARLQAAGEFTRLARRLVVGHCPTQGTNGIFRGAWADATFEAEFRRLYRLEPPQWVKDHLAAGHPSPEELQSLFPGCTLSGDQNCDVWLKYMLKGEPSSGRPGRFLTGLSYSLSWRRRDDQPPFRSALFVYEVPQRPR